MPVNKKILELSEEEFNRFFKRVEPVEEGKTPAQYNEPLDITKIDDTAFNKIAKDLDLDSQQMKRERETKDRAEKRNAEAFVRQQKDTRDEARKKRRDDFKRSAEEKREELRRKKTEFDEKFGKIYQMIRAVNSAALKRDALQKSFANPDLDDKDEVQIVESNTINQQNLDKSRELLREAEIFFRENKDKIENLMSSLTGLISAIEGVNYKQEEDVFRKDLRRRYADFEKAENELGQLFNQSNKKFKDVCEKMRIALDDLFNNFTRFIEFTGIQGKIDKEEKEKKGLEDAVKTSVAKINKITGNNLNEKTILSQSLDNVLGIDYDSDELNIIKNGRYSFKLTGSRYEGYRDELLNYYSNMLQLYKVITSSIKNSKIPLEKDIENYNEFFLKILRLTAVDKILSREEYNFGIEEYYYRVQDILEEITDNSVIDLLGILQLTDDMLKYAKKIIIKFNNYIDRYNQEQEEKFSNDFASSFGGQMPEFFRKELEEKKKEQSEGETGNELKRVQDKYNKLIEHVNVLQTTKKIKDIEEEIQKLKEELKKLEETKKSIQDEKNIIAGLCGNRSGPSLPESEESKLKRELDTKKGQVDGLNEELTQQKDRADRADRDRDAALQDAQQEKQRLQDAIDLRDDALASAQKSEREKEEAVKAKNLTQQELDEKTEELNKKIQELQNTTELLKKTTTVILQEKSVIEELKKKLRKSEIERLNNKEEIVRLKRELKEALEEYTERKQELTRELLQHQSETKNLKNKLTSLRLKNGLGIVQYGVLKQRLEKEEARRKDLERNLGTATTENESLQQQLNEAINTSEERQNNVDDLTRQLSDSEGEKTRLQQELDEARAEHSQSLGELQQVLSEKESLSSQEKDRMQGIIDGLREEKSQLEQRTTDIESLQQERDTQAERLASLEEERQSHDERVSELENKINELQSELEGKKFSLGVFERTFEGLQGNLSEQKELVSMYKNKTKELLEDLVRRGEINEELQDELKELREKLKSGGTEEEREEARQGLESKISELKQEVGRLTEEKGTREQLHSSKMEYLKEQVRELTSKAESSNDSVQQLTAEKESLEKSSSVSLRELNARNIILEEETKKAVSSLAEAENYNAVLKGELETATQENQKNRGLASHNKDLAGQLTDREQKIEILEREKDQLTNAIQEEKKRVTEFSSGNEELLLEIQNLEKQKQEISKELTKTESQRVQLQTNYNEELVYRENLLGQLTEVHENFRNLEREREELYEKLQSALKGIEILKKEEEKWKAENISINEENQGLKQQNISLNEENQGLKQQNEENQGLKQQNISINEENQGLKQQNDILKEKLEETVNLVMEKGSDELRDDVERELKTAFSSPLKLQRPKQLSPMSKIKNMRNSRRMAVEKLKY